MNREKILFIINPAAGSASVVSGRLTNAARQCLDQEIFETEFIHTSSKENASLITKKKLSEGYRKFVAVGGDGTINEIGRILVGTPAVLGIIPAGSGNGLARHLRIPLRLKDALKIIRDGEVMKIDHGLINRTPFFCTAGLGFDAALGRHFAENHYRGLSGYIKSGSHEFWRYKPKEYHFSLEGKSFRKKAFLVTIANASQFGNNAYIAPAADITDGLLDLVIISPFPTFFLPGLAFRLFTKRVEGSRYIEIVRIKTAEIHTEEQENDLHFDGEPSRCGQGIRIESRRGGLNVIVRRSQQETACP